MVTGRGDIPMGNGKQMENRIDTLLESYLVTDGWTWTMLETSLELAPHLNGIFLVSFYRDR